jgi:hypothetical protein
MLERKRAAFSARETSSQSSPAFLANFVELPLDIHQDHAMSWQTPFIVEQSMDWSNAFDGSSPVMLSSHSSSPALSQDFSPTSTLQELSPVSHVEPLSAPPPLPPFQFSSSSLSTALTPSPILPQIHLTNSSNSPAPINSPNFHSESRLFRPDSYPAGQSPTQYALHSGSPDIKPLVTDLNDTYHNQGSSSPLCRSGSIDIHADEDDDETDIVLMDLPTRKDEEQELATIISRDRIALISSDFSMSNSEDLSSTSTPICLDTLTLSPISSPSSPSAVDLPSASPHLRASTLFATSDDQQPRQKLLRRSASHGTLRLSSSLLLSPE